MFLLNNKRFKKEIYKISQEQINKKMENFEKKDIDLLKLTVAKKILKYDDDNIKNILKLYFKSNKENKINSFLNQVIYCDFFEELYSKSLSIKELIIKEINEKIDLEIEKNKRKINN